WYWIIGGILFGVLIAFLTWYFKKRKPNTLAKPFQTNTSPYEEAMKELAGLEDYNLSLPSEIRIVHTKLAGILKRYLSRKQNNNYQNKTTGDVLIQLSDHYPDKDMLAKAASSLRCADAVKFAKYLPPAGESEECIRLTRAVINIIHQQTREGQAQPVNPK
ncbi:MAG: hypothetical protein WKI04_16365, partial [Ferruginibacter sp.]